MLLASPLREDHPVDEFHSGVHALDDFLRRHALKNANQGLGQTYVLLRNVEDPATWPVVLGFFTLSMANVSRDLVAPVLGARLPRYPIPVALLGRLGVDARARGHRLASTLLRDAFRRVQLAAAHVGCTGVLVDAKDESALDFYLHVGFAGLRAEPGRWPQPLFFSMSSIELSLGKLGHESIAG